MRFSPLVVFAVTAACARKCNQQETCSQCLNQSGCVFCSDDGKGGSGNCSTQCSKGVSLTDKAACQPIRCTQCQGNDNLVQVTFGKDEIRVECVNELEPGCVDTDHAVGSIRCYNHEQCPDLEKLGDKRLMVEGKYPYLDDSCFAKDCDQCLTSTDTCEYFSETQDASAGKETTRCVPKGFLKPTEHLTKVVQCPEQGDVIYVAAFRMG